MKVVDGGGKWGTVAQHHMKHTSSRPLSEGDEVFLGTHHPKLDDKGRLFLPAKFREQLQGGLVMTKGHEHSLLVFPRHEFETYAAALQAAPQSNKAARDYVRVVLAAASDEIPDRQGRVTVPGTLRAYAGLRKDCIVIGTGARIEIWDSERWAEYIGDQEDVYADLSEEVVPGVM